MQERDLEGGETSQDYMQEQEINCSRKKVGENNREKEIKHEGNFEREQ